MISFIHCGSEKRLYRFPSGNTSQLMLGRRWLAISVHSNSLVKSLTPFEDDAEIHLLNFLMQPICEQPEEKNLASLKIDFYFEVFKQLKNHVLSSGVISQEQHSIKTLEFTKTNSCFYSFTYEKKHIQQFIIPVGRFFCEFVGRQKSCGFNTKILSACLRYKPGFYFFSLHKIQMRKQRRLIN